MKPALIAGSLAGATGLLVFLTIHHFWIRPIWFILPAGLVIAGFGGLAVGWSYAEIKAGLPPRPWTALAVFALVGGTLLPGIVLAQIRAPLLDVNTGATMRGNLVGVAGHFMLELLLPAAMIGGLAGWWLGGSGKAALATAITGFLFALGPGHNIPLLGNTPGSTKGTVLLFAIVLVAVVVLVESEAWLAGLMFE
jgi:hypothetical protein